MFIIFLSTCVKIYERLLLVFNKPKNRLGTNCQWMYPLSGSDSPSLNICELVDDDLNIDTDELISGV